MKQKKARIQVALISQQKINHTMRCVTTEMMRTPVNTGTHSEWEYTSIWEGPGFRLSSRWIKHVSAETERRREGKESKHLDSMALITFNGPINHFTVFRVLLQLHT